MYTIAIHAQEVLGATLLNVSLSETSPDGSTYLLATHSSSTDLLGSSHEDPLWIFFQQIDSLLSSLFRGEALQPQISQNRDGLDGGWRGVGESGPLERSEIDHA